MNTRKYSDYFANNQLLLAKSSILENVFCNKCDYCPFLGDFSYFDIACRHPVGRASRIVAAKKSCFYEILRR